MMKFRSEIFKDGKRVHDWTLSLVSFGILFRSQFQSSSNHPPRRSAESLWFDLA